MAWNCLNIVPSMGWYLAYTSLSPEEADARIEETYATTAKTHHVYKYIEGRRFVDPRAVRVLELGTCFGTDARRLVADVLAVDRLVVSDLHRHYFDAILHVFCKAQAAAFLKNALNCVKSGGVLFGTSVGTTAEAGRNWGLIPTEGLDPREEVPPFLFTSKGLEALLVQLGFVNGGVESGSHERQKSEGMARLTFTASRPPSEL
ncbi:hypothetical protein BC830DRAFT_1174198 [Chytriomyces sp. MP71]|nr:hypothetical protein BC830DRAFT_1174198 [Chytriomyces sp. MP71]